MRVRPNMTVGIAARNVILQEAPSLETKHGVEEP